MSNREKKYITSLFFLIALVGGIGIVFAIFQLAFPAILGDKLKTKIIMDISLNILIFSSVIAVIFHGIVYGFGRGHRYLIMILLITELFTVYYRDFAPFSLNQEKSKLEFSFAPPPIIEYVKKLNTKNELFRIYDSDIRLHGKGCFYAYSADVQPAFAYTGSVALLYLEEYRKCIPKDDYTSPLWDIFNVKYFYINSVVDKKGKEKLIPVKMESTAQSEKDKLFSEAILSLFSDDKTKSKYKFNLNNIKIEDGFIGKGAFFLMGKIHTF